MQWKTIAFVKSVSFIGPNIFDFITVFMGGYNNAKMPFSE
jgi:hypothetical protein